MLTRLYIKDFALIEEAVIEFGPGLNVVTGETGAGKSILIGALNSILGGPVNAELVRKGASSCAVEGFFELDDQGQVARLADLGVLLEDGQLILRREIRGQGRSRAFVNGQGQPIKQLKQIGAILVDLHGQHEHQSLLDPKLHARFLDAFASLDDQRHLVRQHWRAYRDSVARLDRLRAERDAHTAEDSLRAFQLEEIRRLAPRTGEEAELERELQVLENAETLSAGSLQLYDLLYQREGAVCEALGQVRRQLDRLREIDPALDPQAAALEELIYEVEDLADQLRDYARRIEVRPGRADELRERRDGLRALKKKYGGTLDAVLERARELSARADRADRLHDELVRAAEHRDQALAEFATGCLIPFCGSPAGQRDLISVASRRPRGVGHGQVPVLHRTSNYRGPGGGSPARWASLRGWRARHGARRLPHFRQCRRITATPSAHRLGRGNFARDVGPQGSCRRTRPRFDLGLRRNRRWYLGAHRRGRRPQATSPFRSAPNHRHHPPAADCEPRRPALFGA